VARAYNTRHLSLAERRAHRQAVALEFDEGSARDDKTWDDGFLEIAAVRPSFAPLTPDTQRALDELLDRFDVRSVIGTLAQLCEARAPSEFDSDTDFSDHADSELWEARANALYQCAGTIK